MTSPGKVNGICLDRLDQNRAIIRTIQVIQANSIYFPIGTPEQIRIDAAPARRAEHPSGARPW
jgi:hypothetical protein